MKADAMFNSNGLMDELHALKVDLGTLLRSSSDEFLESKGRADVLADQIKLALNDLSEVLSGEQEQIEKLIAGRPVTTLASAFALGVIVGAALRRH